MRQNADGGFDFHDMNQEKHSLQPVERTSSFASSAPNSMLAWSEKTVAPPKASYTESNPMAAAAHRSLITSRSSSFSLSVSKQQITARPTMQQVQSPLSRGNSNGM